MKAKRKISLAVAALMCLSSAFSAACGKGDGGSASTPDTPAEKPLYTTDNYTFTTVYTSDDVKTLGKYNAQDPTLVPAARYEINKSIGNDAYIKLELESDVNLVGTISYFNATDPTQTNTEKFFVEANSSEYKAFLDSFRGGAYGKYKKVVTEITLQNVDEEKEGTVKLKSFSVSNRDYDPEYMMYIDDGTMRVGTSLSFGGCIRSIERIDGDVVEYLDDQSNIRIERDVDVDEVNVISDSVNLVNTYDLGREIQQSLYWTVKPANGYSPKGDNKYSSETEPNYNPIQCGSAGGIYPQVVDYAYSEDCIYVKAYGQDWFFENNIDYTYYENWFYFGEDGVLIVDNRITNFTQFVGTEKFPATGQETPAFYCVQPLNYFYCETKQGIIMDSELRSIPSTKDNYKTTINDYVSGGYHYEISTKNTPLNWCAFVNSNMFGLGIYSPNATQFNASRGYTSTSITERANTTVNSYMYEEDYGKITPSCWVSNYNYINANLTVKMVDFVPLEFSYALFAGDVDEMRDAFNDLAETGKMVKKELAWPTR